MSNNEVENSIINRYPKTTLTEKVGSALGRLTNSEFRRFFVQKYPGSISGTRYFLGSISTGPLVWIVPELTQHKQDVVKSFSNQYHTLVETGTYRGDMIEACSDYFQKIISIELSEKLYQKAKNRFANKTNVELIQGDSAERLKGVLPTLDEPAIFWLDAHYSKADTSKAESNTPICEELSLILSHPLPHHILIDDARCFNGEEDFPELNSLKLAINSDYPNRSMNVDNDIIQIYPQVT